MKQIKGKFTLLIEQDETNIEIVDETSGLTIVKLSLTPQNFQNALSRLVRVECDVIFNDLGAHKIGKTMIHKSLEFKLLSNTTITTRESDAIKIIDVVCPKGWTPDYYFGSKDSFFKHNDEWWARCIIRKWK